MSEKTKELQARVEQLNEEFTLIRAELTTAQDALREQVVKECGVVVGQVVRSERGKHFRVAGIRSTYDDHVHIDGNQRKKNGEWGDRKHYVGMLGYSCFVVQEQTVA